MSVLAKLLPDNPVLTRELRVRMRGSRAYWILTGYLALLSFVLFVSYTTWWNTANIAGGGFSAGSKVGQIFFYIIIGVQAALVGFITPAITAGAITIEKEQRTLEMLEMTRLPRGSIVAGKLLSAIGFVALLLTSSLPLTSLCFFLGGVSPEQVAYWYLLLLAVSFLTATIGLVWSTVARTTAAAVVLTYSSLFAPMFLYGAVGVVAGTTAGANPQNAILISTMVAGLFGAYSPEMTGMGFMPGGALVRAWDMRHYYGLTLPVWLAPVLTYTLLGLTLASVAAARLETFPERKAGWLRALVTLFVAQQLFFFFGARFASYAQAGPAAGTGFPALYALAYPVILLLFLTPIFATGEVRPVEARRFGGYLAGGWTPNGLRRGRVASGLPFLLVLTAISLGLYAVSFALVGQPRAFATGFAPQITAPPVAVAPLAGAAPPPAPAFAQPPEPGATGFLHAGVALAATLAGLCALGMALSVALRNRWAAMALLYVLLVAIVVTPSIARTNYQNQSPFQSQEPARGPSLYINLYYLNPVMAIQEATDLPDHFWSPDMALAFGRSPMWQVCTAGWLLVTGLSLVLMLPFVSRIAGGPKLAFEDMAAGV